jgi:clan AA aspartic protease
MITGVVNRRTESILRLTIIGSDRREAEVDAVIDTGFTGSLRLPLRLIHSLELDYQSEVGAALADGSRRVLDTYTGRIRWDGRERDVLVYAAESNPLIGMRLLAGHELTVQAWPGGDVRIVAAEPGRR